MEWIPQFYRAQSQEVESLEDKYLDGRIMLKSGQDSPSQKPMCSPKLVKLGKIIVREINGAPTTNKCPDPDPKSSPKKR